MGSLYLGAQDCVPVLLENFLVCLALELVGSCVGVLVGGVVFLLSGVQ